MNKDFFGRVITKTWEELELIKKSGLPETVYEQEKFEMYLAEEVIDIDDETNSPSSYLYHGIRFQNYLEKLESIFKDKKILAGKYLPDVFQYSDNCNKGEYVSLTSSYDKQVFDVFILPNISLLVSPKCKAYLTKYVDYNTWDQIKDKKTKNLYSYMKQEYMCKDYVPFDLVKAVGVPYTYYIIKKGIEYADTVLQDVQNLVDKYKLDIKIVDTSDRNKILMEPEKRKII